MIRDVKPLPGYLEPYGLLAAILQDGTREWRGELDTELSEDAVVWQPAPDMHSIGALILHMISVEVGWFEGFVLNLPRNLEERKLLMADETDVDDWRWPVPPRKPLAWYLALQDQVRARILEGLKSWPEADVMREDDEDARTPRWVFGHVIQHEAYHGGQAVLLQRLWELQNSGGS